MAKRDFKAQLTRPQPSAFDRDMYGIPESNETNEVNGIHETNEVNDLHEVNVAHVSNDQHESPVAPDVTDAPLADTGQFIPFSTRITIATFIKLKQAEYWERLTITEIVETALEQYLKSIPTAANPLPEKEQKRLKVRKLQVPSSPKKR